MMMMMTGVGRCRRSVAVMTMVMVTVGGLFVRPAMGAPAAVDRRATTTTTTTIEGGGDEDPFAVLDAQHWRNPDDMTWDEFVAPPNTSWADPGQRGSMRNFNIALIAVDYPDEAFVVTQPAQSTIFGNPQAIVSGLAREAVPGYYRDLLNTPGELNGGHTLHEYWMEDSGGRFGVDLTAFGPYRLPSASFAYGIDDDFNPGACPTGRLCSVDLRTDALGAWRAAVGNDTAGAFELVFILSAGQDESSTWQEFGEMRFGSRDNVSAAFGPPNSTGSPNYAHTRYVEWTAWASASTIWPNAGGGSSTQAESSGMATYAHELSHLLSIGDNYNNPYGVPLRRAFTGPWSMMSRGSFNGPGGPHSRWHIPALHGGALGSLHTLRDKLQLGLVANSSVLLLSREQLALDGDLVVAQLTARSVVPGAGGLMGLRVSLDADRSPRCNISTDVFCDGGGFNAYDVEVVDRMGADSFTPDAGVMLSKTKADSRSSPFQWTIDANPHDIQLVDFIRPNGTAAMITLGDYRQLADALFHAGTRSGSQYEYVDEANRLHFYILDVHRDAVGVLSYSVGVRSLDGSGNSTTTTTRGVALEPGRVVGTGSPKSKGVTCVFPLANNGSSSSNSSLAAYLSADVYRLSATVDADGWRVQLPNALATAPFGASTAVRVAVAAASNATASAAVVRLTAVSESDPSVSASAECPVEV